MDDRRVNNKLEYMIKWKGYNRPEDITWEPAKNVASCPELVEAFKKEKARKASLNSHKPPGTARKSTFVDGTNSDNVTKASRRSSRSRHSVTPQAESSSASPVQYPSPEEVQKEPSSPKRSPVKQRTPEDAPEEPSPLKHRTPEDDPKEPPSPTRSPLKHRTPEDDPKEPSPKRSRTDPPISKVTLRTRHPSLNDMDFKRWSPRNMASHMVPVDRCERTYTPATEIPDLKFIVKEIKGMYGDDGAEDAVVLTEAGELVLANCKAINKQNPDLMMDYLLSCVHTK